MEREPIAQGYVQMRDGVFTACGSMSAYVPDGDEEIDAAGAYLLPGIVDAHTHIGIWEEGIGGEGDDTNEGSDPATPHLRAIDAINTRDPPSDGARGRRHDSCDRSRQREPDRRAVRRHKDRRKPVAGRPDRRGARFHEICARGESQARVRRPRRRAHDAYGDRCDNPGKPLKSSGIPRQTAARRRGRGTAIHRTLTASARRCSQS